MTAKITWHSHANFQIQGTGYNLLIDPFFTGNPSATAHWKDLGPVDMVLVTHLHGDHSGDAPAICKATGATLVTVVGCAAPLVQAGVPENQVVNGIGFNIGGTVTVKGVEITMTEAFHTSDSGSPTGFIIKLPDGYTVYHSGDTGIFANMEIWGALYPLDLALLPTGGVFTMDARQAAMAAGLLKCKAVIPMHWGTFPALARDTAEFQAQLAARAPGCRFVHADIGRPLDLP